MTPASTIEKLIGRLGEANGADRELFNEVEALTGKHIPDRPSFHFIGNTFVPSDHYYAGGMRAAEAWACVTRRSDYVDFATKGADRTMVLLAAALQAHLQQEGR